MWEVKEKVFQGGNINGSNTMTMYLLKTFPPLLIFSTKEQKIHTTHASLKSRSLHIKLQKYICFTVVGHWWFSLYIFYDKTIGTHLCTKH